MAVIHFSKVLAQYPNPNINRSETQVYTLPYPVLHERWGSRTHFVLVPRCSTKYSLGFLVAVGFLGCRRARAGSPEKKFEVMGGRADVPRDPAMAGRAAHSIRDCTPFLAKPKQQGGRAYLPEPTLQTPCSPFDTVVCSQAITTKTSLFPVLSQPRGYGTLYTVHGSVRGCIDLGKETTLS